MNLALIADIITDYGIIDWVVGDELTVTFSHCEDVDDVMIELKKRDGIPKELEFEPSKERLVIKGSGNTLHELAEEIDQLW